MFDESRSGTRLPPSLARFDLLQTGKERGGGREENRRRRLRARTGTVRRKGESYSVQCVSNEGFGEKLLAGNGIVLGASSIIANTLPCQTTRRDCFPPRNFPRNLELVPVPARSADGRRADAKARGTAVATRGTARAGGGHGKGKEGLGGFLRVFSTRPELSEKDPGKSRCAISHEPTVPPPRLPASVAV